MDTKVMTERELRAELKQLQEIAICGNLTVMQANRMTEIKMALSAIDDARAL